MASESTLSIVRCGHAVRTLVRGLSSVRLAVACVGIALGLSACEKSNSKHGIGSVSESEKPIRAKPAQVTITVDQSKYFEEQARKTDKMMRQLAELEEMDKTRDRIAKESAASEEEFRKLQAEMEKAKYLAWKEQMEMNAELRKAEIQAELRDRLADIQARKQAALEDTQRRNAQGFRRALAGIEEQQRIRSEERSRDYGGGRRSSGQEFYVPGAGGVLVPMGEGRPLIVSPPPSPDRNDGKPVLIMPDGKLGN